MLKKPLLLLGLLLGVSLFWAVGTAHAADFIGGKNANLGSDQIVDGTLYIAGSTVNLAATVNGDVFCAGQTVEITGTVNGDVICAAQQLHITGKVNGDVRVGAQALDMTGSVSGSLTAFAQTYNLSSGASVGRDATVTAQTATFDGKIGRDLLLNAKDSNLNGNIGGSVTANVDTLALSKTSAIAGSLTYTSNNDVSVQTGSKIGGTTVRHFPPQQMDKFQWTAASRAALSFYWFMAMLLVGVVLLFACPKLLDTSAHHTKAQPWTVLGWGLVGVFLTPMLGVFVAITVIGIPLMLIGLVAWALVLSLSTVFSGYALGWIVLKQIGAKLSEGKLRFASLALGLFIISIAFLIPVIGGLAGLLAVTFGSGSLLYSLRNKVAGAKAAAKGV